METFELWSYDVKGDLGEYAQHTYIRCPDKNTYFNCWGDHQSSTETPGTLRFSCAAIYDVADCYRRNIFNIKDTAGIGVYAVNGVCHQTANLFLYSSGRTITIDDGVKGYGLSSLAYGTYGDFNPLDTPLQQAFLDLWKTTVYNKCYAKYLEENRDSGNVLFQDIKQLYKSAVKELKIPSHELIHEEAALLIRHSLLNIDPQNIKNIHLDFLKEKHSIINARLKGAELANKINEAAIQFQNSLSERIGADAFSKLTGLRPGETIKLVDPKIAAVAYR